MEIHSIDITLLVRNYHALQCTKLSVTVQELLSICYGPYKELIIYLLLSC